MTARAPLDTAATFAAQIPYAFARTHGVLASGLEGEAVVIDTGEETVALPLTEIERGKLVLTDALLKSAKPANA